LHSLLRTPILVFESRLQAVVYMKDTQQWQWNLLKLRSAPREIAAERVAPPDSPQAEACLPQTDVPFDERPECRWVQLMSILGP
jgi:hypothetical protein